MKTGDQYYSIFMAYGNIQAQSEVWEDGHLDHLSESLGNVFPTKELAESKILDIQSILKNKPCISRTFLE